MGCPLENITYKYRDLEQCKYWHQGWTFVAKGNKKLLRWNDVLSLWYLGRKYRLIIPQQFWLIELDILGKLEVLVRGCKCSRTDPHGHFTKSRERHLKHLLGNTEAEMWWSWKNALKINNIVNALELMLLGITEISNIFILYSITRWF